MSGIYIPGISMPDNCHVCDAYAISDLFGLSCPAVDTGEYDFHGRPKGCPLIPVPDHGKLIDADALDDILADQSEDVYNRTHAPRSWEKALSAMRDYLDNAPTIIPASPADKEGEG